MRMVRRLPLGGEKANGDERREGNQTRTKAKSGCSVLRAAEPHALVVGTARMTFERETFRCCGFPPKSDRIVAAPANPC